MTNMTHEQQIESWRTLLSDFVATFAPNEAIAAYHDCRLEALYDLAKRGLATMPRPISEAPKDGEKILLLSASRPNLVNIGSWECSVPTPAFMDDQVDSYFDATHFIPVSALEFKP